MLNAFKFLFRFYSFYTEFGINTVSHLGQVFKQVIFIVILKCFQRK